MLRSHGLTPMAQPLPIRGIPRFRRFRLNASRAGRHGEGSKPGRLPQRGASSPARRPARARVWLALREVGHPGRRGRKGPHGLGRAGPGEFGENGARYGDLAGQPRQRRHMPDDDKGKERARVGDAGRLAVRAQARNRRGPSTSRITCTAVMSSYTPRAFRKPSSSQPSPMPSSAGSWSSPAARCPTPRPRPPPAPRAPGPRRPLPSSRRCRRGCGGRRP